MKESLPRHLTVPYIIANATRTFVYDTAQENDKINIFLVENGVVLDDENDTSAERQAAHVVLRDHPNFWVKHWPLHPNGHRCRKWMKVQGRFRRTIDTFISSTNNLASRPIEEDEKLRFRVVNRLSAEFHKFEEAFFSHLEFEQLVMFPALIYYGAPSGDEVKHALNGLIENYAKLEVPDDIYNSLHQISSDSDSYAPLKQTLTDDVTKYAENLEAHMIEKEALVIGILLRLPPEKYKYYRKHIPWKYKIKY